MARSVIDLTGVTRAGAGKSHPGPTPGPGVSILPRYRRRWGCRRGCAQELPHRPVPGEMPTEKGWERRFPNRRTPVKQTWRRRLGDWKLPPFSQKGGHPCPPIVMARSVIDLTGVTRAGAGKAHPGPTPGPGVSILRRRRRRWGCRRGCAQEGGHPCPPIVMARSVIDLTGVTRAGAGKSHPDPTPGPSVSILPRRRRRRGRRRGCAQEGGHPCPPIVMARSVTDLT